MRAIKRVKLGPQHHRPGKTRHMFSDGGQIRPFPPFVSLTIAQPTSEGGGYYLMHECESHFGTDTHHDSLQEALGQAEFEFGVKREEWVDVDEPYQQK